MKLRGGPLVRNTLFDPGHTLNLRNSVLSLESKLIGSLTSFLSDQDYEMNNDEEYDVDVDESGTYLPDNRRYRRSVPRTMWTLEKV